MKYTLLQIESGESLTLDEEQWLTILETAQKEGWDPEGTRFDLFFEMDEAFEEDDDELYRLFSYLTLNSDYVEWDGNYTDRANQVISETDAYYLFKATEDVIDTPPLFSLLAKGSIRICK